MNLNKLTQLLNVSIRILAFLLLMQIALLIGLVVTSIMLSASIKGTIIVVGFFLVTYLSFTRLSMAAATLKVYADILHQQPWFFMVLGKITIASMLFTFGLDVLVAHQFADIPRAFATVKQSLWLAGKHVLLAYGILFLYTFRHLVHHTKRKGGYYYIVQRLPAPKEQSQELS